MRKFLRRSESKESRDKERERDNRDRDRERDKDRDRDRDSLSQQDSFEKVEQTIFECFQSCAVQNILTGMFALIIHFPVAVNGIDHRTRRLLVDTDANKFITVTSLLTLKIAWE